MLLGAHVSAAGGVSNAPGRGLEIGAEAIAIFSKNQRQWIAKPYTDEEVAAFRENMAASGLRKTVVHDSYLINLGAPKHETWQKSRDAFLDEMARCSALGVPYLNFHPGAHVGSGEDACIARIIETLRGLLAEHEDPDLMLLVENTAGQGTNVGYSFEHVGRILDGVDDDRMGVCLDTQHAFAAGYDLSHEAGYEAMWESFDDHIGLDRLHAFHVNDSKAELDARVDRHERVGRGAIGPEAFVRLVNDARFDDIPGLMETPGGMEGWAEDIAWLKRMRGQDPTDVTVPRPKAA